ncbi:hypothetical protein DL546_000456 [Coniochaeta pulveracea]|uniref:TOM core complex subunit Tom6 n=1 Tax=Coniochaeta pulveracea TaxID=177199 RepID=A0A420XWF1_9PEZI|nr:hypothetical protein DL546_000456 [Coniochaeta pulveracea]
MPPKRVVQVQRAGGRGYEEPKGVFGSTIDALTSKENRAVLTSIAAFGAAVVFLSSSLGEAFLLQ